MAKMTTDELRAIADFVDALNDLTSRTEVALEWTQDGLRLRIGSMSTSATVPLDITRDSQAGTTAYALDIYT